MAAADGYGEAAAAAALARAFGLDAGGGPDGAPVLCSVRGAGRGLAVSLWVAGGGFAELVFDDGRADLRTAGTLTLARAAGGGALTVVAVHPDGRVAKARVPAAPATLPPGGTEAELERARVVRAAAEVAALLPALAGPAPPPVRPPLDLRRVVEG